MPSVPRFQVADRIGRIKCRSQLSPISQVGHDRKQREQGTAESHLPRLNVAAGKLDEGLHCKEDHDRADLQRNAPHRVYRSRPHVLHSCIAVLRQENAPDSTQRDL